MRALVASYSNQHWFFKYKIYHLPFWFIYHYLWWVVAVGNPVKAFSSLLALSFAIKYSFYVIFQALAVYLNLYVLIPRLLEKSRFALYVGCLLVTIAGATLLIMSGYYVSAYASGRTLADLYGGGTEADLGYRFLGNALPSTVASMTLAMSIKLTKNWVQTRQRQQVLETEQLEAELKFLKNQFNPHFLFNTINSIFFLIHKDPGMASASLAKFSELLRYQLYECNDPQIPLRHELSYLENFIALEKLRQNQNMTVNLELDLPPVHPVTIAPFVLMSFVENAFKHVSKHVNEPNWITIQLSLDEQQLHFLVTNSASSEATHDVIQSKGLGLKNVQRRLDLLYPQHYQLTIDQRLTQFTVQLQLTLAEIVPMARLQRV